MNTKFTIEPEPVGRFYDRIKVTKSSTRTTTWMYMSRPELRVLLLAALEFIESEGS